MATLACRVQFLDDTDPFNSTNFPEPSRPPLFTFREDLALGTQLAGVHRLLRAPHKVRPTGASWVSWTQPVLRGARRWGHSAQAGVGAAPRDRRPRADLPLPVRQRGPGHPPAGAGSPGRERRRAPRSGPERAGPSRCRAGRGRDGEDFPGAVPLARLGGRGGAPTPAVCLATWADAERGAERTRARGTQV